MTMTSDLITFNQLMDLTRQPEHRLRYAVRKHRVKPAQMIGPVGFYSPKDVMRIAMDCKAIAERKAAR